MLNTLRFIKPDAYRKLNVKTLNDRLYSALFIRECHEQFEVVDKNVIFI